MIKAKKIYRSAKQRLSIDWNDQSSSDYSLVDLRDACPCAFCIDEWTRKKTLERSKIRPDIDISDLSIVGQYAIQIKWNDGHNTGIYPFKMLKELPIH